MSVTYRAVAEAPHDGVGVSFAGLQDAVGEVGGVDGIGEILQSRSKGKVCAGHTACSSDELPQCLAMGTM